MVLASQGEQTAADLQRRGHRLFLKFAPVIAQQLGQPALDTKVGPVFRILIQRRGQLPPGFSCMRGIDGDQLLGHPGKARRVGPHVAGIEIRAFSPRQQEI